MLLPEMLGTSGTSWSWLDLSPNILRVKKLLPPDEVLVVDLSAGGISSLLLSPRSASRGAPEWRPDQPERPQFLDWRVMALG